VRTSDGGSVTVTVFLKEGQYMIYLAGQQADDRYCHWGKYASQSEAMTVAFELVDSLKNET
jgi:hypothetical protein